MGIDVWMLRAGLRIVDWRDPPIRRLYYRYNEGDIATRARGRNRHQSQP